MADDRTSKEEQPVVSVSSQRKEAPELTGFAGLVYRTLPQILVVGIGWIFGTAITLSYLTHEVNEISDRQDRFEKPGARYSQDNHDRFLKYQFGPLQEKVKHVLNMITNHEELDYHKRAGFLHEIQLKALDEIKSNDKEIKEELEKIKIELDRLSNK